MDEFTFVDVKETPELLPSIIPTIMSMRQVKELALGALEVAGATPDAVLGTFSASPNLWPIPPRLSKLESISLGMKLPESRSSSAFLIDLHLSLRNVVRRSGMGAYARSVLEDAFGPKSRHPLLFTSSTPSKEAADLFSVEFILAAGGPSKNLVIQANTMNRRFPGKRAAISNLKLNAHISPGIQADWLDSKVYGPRGTAVYGTVDVFDRCLLWVTKAVPKEESGPLKLLLSWLKAAQDKNLAYEFEQALLDVTPYVEEIPDFEFAHLLYTEESLNLARDIWVLSEEDDYQAFRDFYDFVVPTYLDDDEFRKVFKTGMVLKPEFNEDIRKKVDLGLPTFAAWFLKRMRKYGRK